MRGEGYVFRRKGERTWYFANPSLGIKRTSAETESKAEAKKKLRILSDSVRAGISPDATKVTVAELIQAKLRQMELQERSSLRNQIIRARHLLKFYGTRTLAKDLASLGVDKFQTWRAEQTYAKRKSDGSSGIEKPVSNSEINRETEFLIQAFNYGVKRKVIPATYIPVVDKLKEPPPKSLFFEWAQFWTLFSNLPTIYASICWFYLITGWRHDEVLGLKWHNIDFAEREIRLEKGITKGGEGRVFAFTSGLEKILTERRKITDEFQRDNYTVVSWVFHRDGQQIKSFYKAWNTACKKSGLAGLTIHAFRKTAVRAFKRAGINDKVGMSMVGHRTRAMYDRYDIVSSDDYKEAAEMLDRYFEMQEQKMKGGAK